ncbi:MAG TPA: hypothetical protein VMW95_03020, partial [Desulfobacterales bacterium]|nr:hypothetical protein [Desulfobacterales bacterium]
MKIIALTDYKVRFGSKHFDQPYRSGMDKEFLAQCFNDLGCELEFVKLADVDFSEKWRKRNTIIYTSIEDLNYFYKSYIEDVILALQEMGNLLIPNYIYLKANNNKVFMEMLRISTRDQKINSKRSYAFGCKEDLMMKIDGIRFPAVIKTAEGSSGSGVFLVKNEKELIKKVERIASTKNILYDLKDLLRPIKHRGYIRDSVYRKKFVVQEFIPGLKNDWKVYCFGGKIYIFYRPIFKKRGFRASGGGYDNYFFGEKAPKPEGIFNFCKHIIGLFNVPNASLDIAYDGSAFHLLEFQFLYFGTAGIPYSNGY